MNAVKMLTPMIFILSSATANAANYYVSTLAFYDLVPTVISKAHCAVIPPNSSPVEKLELGDHHGHFDVYGDAKLAPASVSISVEEPTKPGSWPFQLTFYSKYSDRIESLPYVVTPYDLDTAYTTYVPSVSRDNGNSTTFPVFAKRWEFLGVKDGDKPAPFACLYFVPDDAR